jgi:hypothetical protein
VRGHGHSLAPAAGLAAPLLLALTLLLALLGSTVLAEKAEAKVPINSFQTAPTSTQAGSHGDLLIAIGFRPDLDPDVPCDCNLPKDITFNTPPGVLGLASNLPRCTLAEFAVSECPVESQVGIAYIELAGGGGITLALFNMVSRADQAALLAIELAAGVPIYTSFTVRTESDFGLESKTFGIIRGFVKIAKINYIFWGIPGDPSHDALRFPVAGFGKAAGDAGNGEPFNPPKQIVCFGGFRDTTSQLLQGINPLHEPDGICSDQGEGGVQPAVTPYNGAIQPFITNPTNCSGPLQSDVDVLAYDLETDHAQTPYPAITGCDQLSFDPSLTAKPTTTAADSPSGLDAELSVPEPSSPDAPSPSQIRGTSISLPDGFTINPNAANGKLSCSSAQASFGTRDEAQCPENSKIGTLELHSTALPGVLPGAIYLGEPLPGNRYRIFLTADGFSLHIKLAGYAVPEPTTGRLTVTFPELPQAPFQRFTFHIFGGERGLLTTPTQCGTYPVKTAFVPWDNELPNQTSTQFFVIDSGPGGTPCPAAQRPFHPELNAGVTDNTAGHHTDFVLDLTRRDGDQNLTGVDVSIPPGFSAILAGIPYCPDASLTALAQASYLGLSELASPACAASQVGTTVASAGSGSRPVSLAGKVYLAGPYKGSPLSLAVVTPAVSGPYDLGNVVVRVAVNVNSLTAQVSAVSDSLPQILEGIPLRLRRVLVMLDRPDFALNPTNCSRSAVEADVSGDQGAQSHLSVPFQVANCGVLDFAPDLSIGLSGGLARRGHPAIHAVFKAKSGEANSRSVQVTLPKGELLDNGHIRSICTRVQFASGSCPGGSRIGMAEAHTPVLGQPLKGSVFLRSSSNKLPDLVLDLKGQVDFVLVGRVDSVNGRLRTTFESVPDVPVSKFVLDLEGGGKGLLINSEPLCGADKKATVRMTGQNGKSLVRKTKVQAPCGKARKKRHARKVG